MTKSADGKSVKGLLVAGSIPFGLVVTGVVLLYIWVASDAARELTVRLPDPNNLPQAVSDEIGVAELRTEFLESNGVPADLPGAWPRFRGPNFDGISEEDVDLA
ncbi:MAG: hypothetical protein ACYS83_08065, partial [Planctomycetota bacterium]